MTSLVSVKVEAPDLAGLVAAMNAAGQDKLRKDLAKSLRQSADKIVRAEQQAVMGLSSKAKHTKKQTAQHAAKEIGKRKNVSSDKFFAAIEGAGLRRSISNSIERLIRYRGKDVGVRVRARASKMPSGMERLPRLTNKGKWGHPFMGHRNIWVNQTTSPAHWWTKTGQDAHADVRREIELVLKAYAQKLRAKG